MTISKELLDELLSGVERPEDLLDDKGLMKELKVRLMERMLDDDMGAGFQRKRARLGFEFRSGKGTFDIVRASVVPLDQVRVVAVHHSDQVSQRGRAVRMQPLSKPGSLALEIDRQVRQTGRSAPRRSTVLSCRVSQGFFADLVLAELSSFVTLLVMKSKSLPMCLADHRCRHQAEVPR